VVKGQPRQLQDSTYQTGHYGRNTSVRHGIGASYGTEGAKSSRAFGEWCYQWAVEALRVAKPGAHILAFGGTRTYHRLVCALEDAGWEVRDSLQLFWTYGSGFPKSSDVSKAIDKAAGAEREVVGTNANYRPNSGAVAAAEWFQDRSSGLVTAPATDAARRWEGWGTALKPAYEPIVVARKPLIGTVARNVLRYGTGGLNIAGCSLPSGRWPANAILCHAPECVCTGTDGPETVETWECVDECPVKLMEEQSPGASRFFYSVKANANDRWVAVSCSEGCAFHGARMSRRAAKASATKPVKGARDGLCRSCGGHRSHAGHPTVKPEGLMRYLVRLVTPPGGVVLDPFCGSGSTGVAVVKEGFRFLGVDKTPAYVQLSRARLADVLDKLSKNQSPVEEADLGEEELETEPDEELEEALGEE
jgi:site-specific DNA-methyltransferase (adenine-specific)